MKKIFKWLKDFFELKCPNCYSDLRVKYLDIKIAKPIYECSCCGEVLF